MRAFDYSTLNSIKLYLILLKVLAIFSYIPKMPTKGRLRRVYFGTVLFKKLFKPESS